MKKDSRKSEDAYLLRMKIETKRTNREKMGAEKNKEREKRAY